MISVVKISDDQQFAAAAQIRKTVFVDEQHCPADLETENDEVSTHFLAYFNSVPCGACRWRRTSGGYKLERFAVLVAYRGKGVARAMIRAVLEDLPKDNATRYLNSQLDAMPVYLKAGFTPVGDIFEEAGILHWQMKLQPPT